MEEMYYKTIKETLYHEKLDNGLDVFLLPKKGFTKTYGLFTTNFGSIDTTFKPLNQNEFITVNNGIAHFLEHKMFDMKDGDASDEFAKLGASSNAFTSNTRTSYLFNTTSNVESCVELLLDFVQSLDITEASVEKEKGIIVQEIKMYDDDPDWEAYFGSISNLYQKHPVKNDIAGDEESVNNTTVDMLTTCYNTFYNPGNMMLFVSGNIDVNKLMEVIKNNQDKKSFIKEDSITRFFDDEPLEVATKRKEIVQKVEMNKFMLSIKINDILKDPLDNLKRELAVNILLDCLFSKSSDLYTDWIEKKYINQSFSVNYTASKNYAYIQFSGEQEDYQLLEKTIVDFIKNIDTYEISNEMFERKKKNQLGSFIGYFTSPETIANLFSRYYFEGFNCFEIIDRLNELTLEEVIKTKDLFKEEYSSVYIIKNK